MSNVADEVLEIAREITGYQEADCSSAIDQDFNMAGDDVTEFVRTLHQQFGDVVYEIPWHRFTDETEGLGLFAPVMLIWYLLTWPLRGRFGRPSTLERLEVRHIAFVIGRGEWVEPKQ
ncbi:hypothetical protein [Parasphingopyxis sp.]|uniref:hypothetical protein n=1 Tax=Parasphingopyxis sp. TaxID=1920299 RepID=UPI002609FC1A|nr:hypothetical protein [Parasphingopyxis sp.]